MTLTHRTIMVHTYFFLYHIFAQLLASNFGVMKWFWFSVGVFIFLLLSMCVCVCLLDVYFMRLTTKFQFMFWLNDQQLLFFFHFWIRLILVDLLVTWFFFLSFLLLFLHLLITHTEITFTKWMRTIFFFSWNSYFANKWNEKK